MEKQKPKKLRFTEHWIRNLEAPEKRTFYYDTVTKGLALRVTPSGRKSFYLYAWEKDTPVKRKLNEFGKGADEMSLKEARERIIERAGERVKGKTTPGLTARRGSRTIRDIFDEYMQEHVAEHCKPLTVSFYKSIFKRHLAHQHDKEDRLIREGWEDHKILDIRRQDVLELQRFVKDHTGPVAANRTITLLRAIFSHAEVQERWDRANPAQRIKPYRESPVERFLGDTDPKEPARFVKAVLGQPEVLQAVFLTQMFTGQRKTQVHSMKWADLDFDRKVWRIPEILKGKRPLQVPLVPELADRLAALERKSEYVFPGERGAAHMGDPRKPWAKVLKDAEIEGLTQHDLRRTLASTLRRLGYSRDLIADILGQSSANNVTAGYLHSDAELTAERRALEAAFDELTRGTALEQKDDASRTGKKQ